MIRALRTMRPPRAFSVISAFQRSFTTDHVDSIVNTNEKVHVNLVTTATSSREIAAVAGDKLVPVNPHALKSVVSELFSQQYLSVRDLRLFMTGSFMECDKATLAHLMRISGKLTKDRRDMLLRFYMPVISARVNMLKSKSWNFTQISCVVFGLQRMKERDNGVLDILASMTELADKTASKREVPNSHHISMMLRGLEKFEGSQQETKDFLVLVVKMMKACSTMFDAQHISSCLYGLQSMKSSSKEVRDVLVVLTERIKESTDMFGPKNVSSSLYGLQGMSCDHPEVVNLLEALETRIQTCQEAFRPKEVTDSLHGLQKLTSDHQVVRNILTCITPMIRDCDRPPTAMGVSNAMIGLRCMHADCTEVPLLLKALTQCIMRPVYVPPPHVIVTEYAAKAEARVLDGQGVKNVFNGMRRMDSENHEVRNLITAVTPLLLASTQKLNANQLTESFNGIQYMSSSRKEVKKLISILTEKVKQCKQIPSPIMVGKCIGSLSKMRYEVKEVRELIAAFIPLAESCKKPLDDVAKSRVKVGLRNMLNEKAVVALLEALKSPEEKAGIVTSVGAVESEVAVAEEKSAAHQTETVTETETETVTEADNEKEMK
jgi:hypothetical protein